jgi:hypothetical protein
MESGTSHETCAHNFAIISPVAIMLIAGPVPVRFLAGTFSSRIMDA